LGRTERRKRKCLPTFVLRNCSFKDISSVWRRKKKKIDGRFREKELLPSRKEGTDSESLTGLKKKTDFREERIGPGQKKAKKKKSKNRGAEEGRKGKVHRGKIPVLWGGKKKRCRVQAPKVNLVNI